MKKLIILAGPTATGKTKMSIEIAHFLNSQLAIKAEVINFDSLLFYKEISIGSAKPTLLERQGIEHHLIDIVSIADPINAADFIKKAQACIEELMSKSVVPILVGGSAFYLRSLLKGMYELNNHDDNAQEYIEDLYKKLGIEAIEAYLKEFDPLSLNNIHLNDHYRLMRAAIHHRASGNKISEQKSILDALNPYDFSKIIHPWQLLSLYLDIPKEHHYEIIKKRTRAMFDSGLMLEIENLKAQGFTLEEKPLTSIGYKEAIGLLNGDYKSQEECMERISISTRQLAKSQRTFFKKIHPKHCFNPTTEKEKIFSLLERFLA